MLKEMKEMGTFNKANYEPLPQLCPDTSGQALGFDSCITLFLIILAGFSASICVLFIECIHYLYPEITWFSSVAPEEQLPNPTATPPTPTSSHTPDPHHSTNPRISHLYEL
jgi:hypothetical protein